MNKETKSIGINTLITLLVVTGAIVTPTFFDTPQYYCEHESSILEATYGVSGGSQTRLYLNEEKNSWDYCRSGWILVTDDRPIQEEEVNETEPEEVPSGANGSYVCYPPPENKCVKIE